LPFFRVRNVLCANIYVPEGAKQNLHHFFSILEFKMMISKPYGTSLDAEEGNLYGDNTIQKRLGKSFSNLDCALDILRGRTANMLRLRRFSSWYDDNHFRKSSYMDELERGALNLEHDTQVFQESADIRWRYRLMVAFNPLSAKMQKLRSISKICEHSMA
jgi:hypothetical protein